MTQPMTKILLALLTLAVLATEASADVLRCKIESYNEDIFIATSPDTNQNDGQYARIGISPGVGDRAIAFADRMGAHVFVELNTDGTPIGLLTVSEEYACDQIKSGNRSLRHGFGAISKCGCVCSIALRSKRRAG
jgi:hypothetical protein